MKEFLYAKDNAEMAIFEPSDRTVLEVDIILKALSESVNTVHPFIQKHDNSAMYSDKSLYTRYRNATCSGPELIEDGHFMSYFQLQFPNFVSIYIQFTASQMEMGL